MTLSFMTVKICKKYFLMIYRFPQNFNNPELVISNWLKNCEQERDLARLCLSFTEKVTMRLHIAAIKPLRPCSVNSKRTFSPYLCIYISVGRTPRKSNRIFLHHVYKTFFKNPMERWLVAEYDLRNVRSKY